MLKVRPDLALFGSYHSPQVDVDVRLNTNESPFIPPKEFLDEVAAILPRIPLNRYPDRRAMKLCEAIADHHGVKRDEVFIANGSNEVISTVLLAYGGPGRSAMTFEPTYAMYSQLAKVTSTALVEVERAADFQLDPLVVLNAIERNNPEIVFFCSPNNPTGLDENPHIISEVSARGDNLVVIDEAYGQFAKFDALNLASNFPNILVSKTFSKVWSLAGIRLGYVIGPSEIITNLWATCLPYHLDALKQSVGLLAMKYISSMEETKQQIISGRAQIESGFDKFGVTYWKSSANFILFKVTNVDGNKLWQELVDRSVLVRNCSAWPRLDNCLRVTVGSAEENNRFLSALEDVLLEIRR